MSTPDGFSDNPLCAEMERRCAEMILVSQAVVTCADVFEQACEPRPPKAEWFEKWPSWWIDFGIHPDDAQIYHRCRLEQGMLSVRGGDLCWPLKAIALCQPMATTGCTPVGWKVVGE